MFPTQNGLQQVDALLSLLFNFDLEYIIRKGPRKSDGTEIERGTPAKTKYMLMPNYHNAGQNHNIRISNRSFESVAEFRYSGTSVIKKKVIHEEIKSRLNLGNASYHSVQSLHSTLFSNTFSLCSSLMSEIKFHTHTEPQAKL
jgi:hypothetical protein